MKLNKLLFRTFVAGLAVAATAGCESRETGERREPTATAPQEGQQPADQREQALEQRKEAVGQQQEAIEQQQQARQELEEARQQQQQAQQEMQQARQQEQQAMQKQEQTIEQQQQARQELQQQEMQQDQQQQAQQAQQEQQQQAQQQPAGGAVPTQQQAQAGQLQGTVESIDVPAGKLTVRSGEQTVTLRGVPTELGNYKQGDTATLRYESFGGENWISQQAGAGPADLSEKYSMAGTVTGTISQLDRNAGIIVVRGTQYAAHPDQLENLTPGQFVSLSYANVEGKNWVAEIQQKAGEQPGGAQEQQLPQPSEQQLPPSQREMEEQPESP